MDDAGEAGEFGSVLQLDFITVSRYFNNFAVSTATGCLAVIIQVLWSRVWLLANLKFKMLVLLTLALQASQRYHCARQQFNGGHRDVIASSLQVGFIKLTE